MYTVGAHTLTDLVLLSLTATNAFYICPAFLVLVYRIQAYYVPMVQRLSLLHRQVDVEITSYTSEVINGGEHIRTFRQQEVWRDGIDELLARSQKTFYYLRIAERRLGLILDIFVTASIVFLVRLAQVFPESTSTASLGLAFLILFEFAPLKRYLVGHLMALGSKLTSMSRIRSFCTETPLESEMTPDEPVPDAWPTTGDIEFANTTTAPGYVSECFFVTAFLIFI